jgi:hypothetical protein
MKLATYRDGTAGVVVDDDYVASIHILTRGIPGLPIPVLTFRRKLPNSVVSHSIWLICCAQMA